MKIEQAMQALEDRKRQFQSRIPARASKMRTRYLREMAEEQVEAARKHLRAIYESHLEVGPDFTALAEHMNHPKYAFWLEGIRRHLQECEAVLAEQPEERSSDAS
jgi:hypothetical protein